MSDNKISKQEVLHVAQLARLTFDEHEQEQLTTQLNNILAYIDKLNELDTSDLTPTTHACQTSNVFREDQVSDSLNRDRALSNAPDSDGATFRVPKII